MVHEANRTIRRCVCTRLHIKGLPTSLNEYEIYKFIADYGPIVELAVYQETESLSAHRELGWPINSSTPERRAKKIYHNRPAGQTAIVTFRYTNSAIACKDELHWRPFPWSSREWAKMSKEKQMIPTISREEIISRLPRDRPLLNVHFETNFMYQRLRGWVKRNLELSKTKLCEWETMNQSFHE